jgi:hypothetical protein
MKAREIAYMPLVTLSPMASEIYHRDLTNRVNRDEDCQRRPSPEWQGQGDRRPA